MSAHKVERISRSALRPLDILLVRGTGSLSAMIAWVNDSFYSHAAIVVSRNRMLEASVVGTRVRSLSDALGAEQMQYCDVYRFDALERLDRRELRKHIKNVVDEVSGTFFPRKGLVWFGMVSVLRNHLPVGRGMRALSQKLLDRMLPIRESKRSCLDVAAVAIEKAKIFGDLLAVKRRTPLARKPPQVNASAFFLKYLRCSKSLGRRPRTQAKNSSLR